VRALYAAIREALAAHAPHLVEDASERARAPRAAVAAVLRESPRDEGGADMLFVLRAQHERDPWSGPIGMPGGRLEEGDPSPRATAERETHEELGLDLASAEYLGRLDDVQASSGSIIVSPYAYALRGELSPPIALSTEIAEAFWMPFATLLDPERATTHRLVLSERELLLRAIRFDEPHHPLLWGLTYRIVEQLFHLAGRALPERVDARGVGITGDANASDTTGEQSAAATRPRSAGNSRTGDSPSRS
jgi:8-oxo-dGTP pyrophosphatase MutT (NUDIX family)